MFLGRYVQIFYPVNLHLVDYSPVVFYSAVCMDFLGFDVANGYTMVCVVVMQTSNP
jgi:hypothetical protein